MHPAVAPARHEQVAVLGRVPRQPDSAAPVRLVRQVGEALRRVLRPALVWVRGWTSSVHRC